MAEEPKLYTTKEIEQLFERLAPPEDPQYGDEIEALVELNVKVTFLLYQSVDSETGKSRRSFTARFYHDDVNEHEPEFPSENYAAQIQDVNGDDPDRDIEFDEIVGLLKIDPDKPMWELAVEPEGLESDEE